MKPNALPSHSRFSQLGCRAAMLIGCRKHDGVRDRQDGRALARAGFHDRARVHAHGAHHHGARLTRSGPSHPGHFALLIQPHAQRVAGPWPDLEHGPLRRQRLRGEHRDHERMREPGRSHPCQNPYGSSTGAERTAVAGARTGA